ANIITASFCAFKVACTIVGFDVLIFSVSFTQYALIPSVCTVNPFSFLPFISTNLPICNTRDLSATSFNISSVCSTVNLPSLTSDTITLSGLNLLLIVMFLYTLIVYIFLLSFYISFMLLFYLFFLLFYIFSYILFLFY